MTTNIETRKTFINNVTITQKTVNKELSKEIISILNKGGTQAVFTKNADLAVWKAVLESGIDGNSFSHGDYLLKLAAMEDNIDLMKLLIEHGADANAIYGRNSDFTLRWASSTEAVELLLKHGANVHAATKKGNTALHAAASP